VSKRLGHLRRLW